MSDCMTPRSLWRSTGKNVGIAMVQDMTRQKKTVSIAIFAQNVVERKDFLKIIVYLTLFLAYKSFIFIMIKR